ncbi:MAG: hypothetical protein OEY55_09310 [Acidimicrobiia bacterium]|nr:hypothetical protein [Acidimicrobiia bacterium]MDH5502732.1 hypothetical protein [Acidimicrobiia bacterium]
MRRQVYRRDIDGPDVVRLSGRGDVVKIEYEGLAIDTVRLAEVRRGVAIPLTGGRELALMGGDNAYRIVVKLDGEHLKPIGSSFNWAGYAPWVHLVTAVGMLSVAALAYAGYEPAWHLAIRREMLLVGLVFLVLYWSRTRWANLVGVAFMVVDILWVLGSGIWSPMTVLLRAVVAGYLGRVVYDEWQAVSQ